jgi:predicted phage terminase large subunit-like protein
MTDMNMLDSILRRDLKAFTHKVFDTIHPGKPFHDNWHLDAIAWQLTRVKKGDTRRLLINQPPRTLKSITASVAFPAWVIGHNPELLVACVSYSDDLTSSLSDQFRRVVDTDWYKRCFPAVRLRRNTANTVATTRGGGRIAISVNGSFTGRGADIIVIDDPLNAQDTNSQNIRQRAIDWYTNTLISRLNDPLTGAIVLVMQRLHEHDLAGHILRTENEHWEKLILPAINDEPLNFIDTGSDTFTLWEPGELLHPERLDLETLEQRRKTMGSAIYHAQYLQKPVPAEGAMIKRAWFKTYETPPVIEGYKRIVQSWDIATTTNESSDWSVCTTWLVIRNDYYLLNVWRNRLEYPELRRKIASLAEEQQANVVIIEKAGPGFPVLQDLRRQPIKGMPEPIGRIPKGSKADRMAVQCAKIEAGQVHIPDDAPWLANYLDEMLSFREGAALDDQVDSTSQFLDWVSAQDGTDGDYMGSLGWQGIFSVDELGQLP